MRLHPRTLPVQRAGRDLDERLWNRAVEQNLDYDEALHDAASYLTATLAGGGEPGGEIAAIVDEVQAEHHLTAVELARALLAHMETLTRYMLRMERHPDDPDRKADEA